MGVQGISKLVSMIMTTQVDLKGIPIFVMNLVLKRHPLAVYYVRRQMVDPLIVGGFRSRCSSSVSTFSEDEDGERYLDHGSLADIDDYALDSCSEDGSDSQSQSFEESMPIEYFTQRCTH